MTDTMITDAIFELLPEYFLKPPSGEDALELLKTMGYECLLKSEDLDLELRKEFTRFFSAPGQHKLPPYESYWVLKKQEEDPINAPRLYSRTTDEVKAIYDKLEIEVLSQIFEPPDHLGFELSVYFTLINAGENVPEDVKKEFIENHVLLWIPDYLKKLGEKQGHFYPLVAKFLLNNFFNN